MIILTNKLNYPLFNIYSGVIKQVIRKDTSTKVKIIGKMSTAALDAVPTVDIDPTGVFKYILLKVYDKGEAGKEPMKIILRGYADCNYHSDIYDKVQEKIKPLDAEPIGGGRMSHDSEHKKLHIYGYSQGYGKADHTVSAKLVKDVYPDYTITISDEGY